MPSLHEHLHISSLLLVIGKQGCRLLGPAKAEYAEVHNASIAAGVFNISSLSLPCGFESRKSSLHAMIPKEINMNVINLNFMTVNF